MKREPMPASVSSTSTPSGVAIASRSSKRDGNGAARVVGAHTPSRRWMLIASRASGPRAGRSSPRSCAAPAPGRSGSAPTRCSGSAAATARPPPTSRSPAACSPPTRRPAGSSGWSPTRARACTRPSRAAARCAPSSTTGYWRRVRERPLALILGLALLFVPMALAAVWAVDDPAAALGIVPARVPGRGRARRRSRRPVDGRGGGVLQHDLHEQHPGDVPRDRRRRPARARQRGGRDLQRRLHRRAARPHDRERQTRPSCCGSCSRTACSS